MKRRLVTAITVIALVLGLGACNPGPGSSPGASPGASTPSGGGYDY